MDVIQSVKQRSIISEQNHFSRQKLNLNCDCMLMSNVMSNFISGTCILVDMICRFEHVSFCLKRSI